MELMNVDENVINVEDFAVPNLWAWAVRIRIGVANADAAGATAADSSLSPAIGSNSGNRESRDILTDELPVLKTKTVLTFDTSIALYSVFFL
mmetsp:Transcript_6936/g.10574  ORF Transcript_6936/g.10574 Transcript_6936/m.10574 type:complete len:92 (-) Transcript_6936:7-282(-)